MEPLVEISGDFAFSYTNNDNYIIQILDNSQPLLLEGGKIYSLRGPNGSGKTTLLNILSGNLKTSKGSITFYNKSKLVISSITFSDYSTTLKVSNSLKGVRRLFQVPVIADDISIIDTVQLAKRNINKEKFMSTFLPVINKRLNDSNFQRAKELLIEFDFKDHFKLAGNLSYGQRRLLNILELINSEASLLLMDEPFANIHPENINKLKLLFRKYVYSKERAIMIIEHDKIENNDFADEIWSITNTNLSIDKKYVED